MEKNAPVIQPSRNFGLVTAKRFIFNLIIVLSMIAVIYGALEIYNYCSQDKRNQAQSIINAQHESDRVIRELDAKFRGPMRIAAEFAADYEAGKIPNDQILDRLREPVASRNIFSFGIAFAEYAYDWKTRMYAKYYVKKDGHLELIDVAKREYYLKDTPYEAWYHQPLKRGPGWMEYYEPEIDTSIAEYGMPIYRKTNGKRTLAGVIYIDFSLDHIRQIMESFDLGKNGYGFIVNREGKYIAHPIDEFVKGGKTVFDVAKETGNEELGQVGVNIVRGQNSIFHYRNEVNGQASLMTNRSIPATGWSLGVVFINKMSYSFIVRQRRMLIRITLAVMLGLVFLLALVFIRNEMTTKKWWLFITISSVIFTAGLGYIWDLALTMSPHQDEGMVIADKVSLAKFIRKQKTLAESMHLPPPVFVPTGVFINSFEILNANNIRVTGYIWQKYQAKDLELKPGIVFPEMISGEPKEQYRMEKNGITTIGWNFNVVIRQNFHYAKYPFDNHSFGLIMTPKNLAMNVIFIPDFDAYELINPASCPGVAKNITLSGWNITSSFFNYGLNDYSTNFGLSNISRQNSYPEFSFNMIIQREFLAPFVSTLLPVFVIICILFAILLMETSDEKKVGQFGLKTSGVVASVSGLLFSIIISHTKVRGDFPVKDIIFIENFYFVLYFIMIVIAVNSFITNANTKISIIQYRDNLIPKLLYWPLIFIIIFAFTLGIFY